MVAVALVYGWYQVQLAPTRVGDGFYVRYEKQTPLKAVLADLQKRGVVRNPSMFALFAKLKRQTAPVAAGTYKVKPGMSKDELLTALRKPISQMVRLPHGWWIARTAKVLEENDVCSAADYIKLANSPDIFRKLVKVSLPKESLEGFLYPDTYDLPPLLGAKGVIERQLKAFQAKVADKANPKADLKKAVTIASMIELEAGVDSDRPLISAVIHNRLNRGMKLEIDATVNYAIQEWKPFKPGEIAKIESPYSTYKNAGLPPGPIGSPTVTSISAALNPSKVPYLYYVARPDHTHYFASDYPSHLANIKKARAERAQAGAK